MARAHGQVARWVLHVGFKVVTTDNEQALLTAVSGVCAAPSKQESSTRATSRLAERCEDSPIVSLFWVLRIKVSLVYCFVWVRGKTLKGFHVFLIDAEFTAARRRARLFARCEGAVSHYAQGGIWKWLWRTWSPNSAAWAREMLTREKLLCTASPRSSRSSSSCKRSASSLECTPCQRGRNALLARRVTTTIQGTGGHCPGRSTYRGDRKWTRQQRIRLQCSQLPARAHPGSSTLHHPTPVALRRSRWPARVCALMVKVLFSTRYSAPRMLLAKMASVELLEFLSECATKAGRGCRGAPTACGCSAVSVTSQNSSASCRVSTSGLSASSARMTTSSSETVSDRR